ncbi:MAG: amidohydrolase family protein [Candidatus Kariarchaeaceae archaeon]|jgi:dihydroorotase
MTKEHQNQDLNSEIEYLPSAIDIHVHFREPGLIAKETMKSGMRAANLGGVTTVIEMPNTNPVTDTLSALHQKKMLAARYPGIIIASGMTDRSVDSGEIVKLAKETRLLKSFLADSTGNLRISWKNLINGINLINRHNSLIMFHAEDHHLISERTENSDEAEVRPIEAEVESVKQVLELANEYPDQLMHVTHVSTLKAAQILSNQSLVTWDVTNKHLQFASSEVQEKGNFAKMNPPLRSPSDVNGLQELLRRGKIPIVASDHAPHTIQDKIGLVAGAPGVQELYPFLIDKYLNKTISKEVLLNVIHLNPKSLLEKIDLQPVLSTIKLDRNQDFMFTKEAIASKCGWSLWENYSLKGKLIH